MFKKLIEHIECDQLIFIPMIDGINLTTDKVKSYENPNIYIPNFDKITPIIINA